MGNGFNNTRNNKNGTKLIISALTGMAVILGLFHTVFIQPLQVQIADLKLETMDKTVDRWTKQDAIRTHNKIEQSIEKACTCE